MRNEITTITLVRVSEDTECIFWNNKEMKILQVKEKLDFNG